MQQLEEDVFRSDDEYDEELAVDRINIHGRWAFPKSLTVIDAPGYSSSVIQVLKTLQ